VAEALLTVCAASKSFDGVAAVRDVGPGLRHGEPSGRGLAQNRLLSEIHTLHTMLHLLVKALCFTPPLSAAFHPLSRMGLLASSSEQEVS
jgi:hypothetical protein